MRAISHHISVSICLEFSVKVFFANYCIWYNLKTSLRTKNMNAACIRIPKTKISNKISNMNELIILKWKYIDPSINHWLVIKQSLFRKDSIISKTTENSNKYWRSNIADAKSSFMGIWLIFFSCPDYVIFEFWNKSRLW